MLENRAEKKMNKKRINKLTKYKTKKNEIPFTLP